MGYSRQQFFLFVDFYCNHNYIFNVDLRFKLNFFDYNQLFALVGGINES